MSALRDASAWVRRWALLVPSSGVVLDVAAGEGRHARLFLERGCEVVAVDADTSRLSDHERLELVAADLEDGQPWPLAGRRFDAVVVTNYLHRPLFGDLVAAVAEGGLLIYETFARGQERFGRPTNPDYLLKPGELLDAARPELRVLAYEDLVDDGKAVQRICALREA